MDVLKIIQQLSVKAIQFCIVMSPKCNGSFISINCIFIYMHPFKITTIPSQKEKRHFNPWRTPSSFLLASPSIGSFKFFFFSFKKMGSILFIMKVMNKTGLEFDSIFSDSFDRISNEYFSYYWGNAPLFLKWQPIWEAGLLSSSMSSSL